MKYFSLLFIFCASLFADAHILCYHRFDDPKPKYKHTNISSKSFLSQINSLKADGKKFVSLSSITTALKTSKQIDANAVSITVDDAYKSFYEKAFPILRDAKIPFTLCVYVEAIDKKYGDYMTWEQIKEVSKYGEIALHSYAHKDLTKLTVDELKKDTNDAMVSFEKHMGFKPKQYAYPFGLYNIDVKNTIKSFGFEAILTVDSGAVNAQSDVHQIERVAMSEETDFKLAMAVKPLDITLQKPNTGAQKTIKGSIQNYAGKTIKVYVAKGDVRTLELKEGKFETTVDMAKVNSKHKLIFYTDDHRYRAKLIEKD
jgi:peptidoglycan/xylan/chitin deacetylase (PgdA/CDA1 family)